MTCPVSTFSACPHLSVVDGKAFWRDFGEMTPHQLMALRDFYAPHAGWVQPNGYGSDQWIEAIDNAIRQITERKAA